MNYEINKDECRNKDKLPRLIHDSIREHVNKDLIIKNMEFNYEQMKPKYPKNHKKTDNERDREMNLFHSKQIYINKAKLDVIKTYQEGAVRYPDVLFDVCSKCQDHGECQQYQRYMESLR